MRGLAWSAIAWAFSSVPPLARKFVRPVARNVWQHRIHVGVEIGFQIVMRWHLMDLAVSFVEARPTAPTSCRAWIGSIAANSSSPYLVYHRRVFRAAALITDFIKSKIARCRSPNPPTSCRAEIAPADRLLTAAEFHRLADVPPEIEWFANLDNAHTRRAYENAVKDFMRFAGIRRPEEFRTVMRAHLIAWRDELRRRELGGATIRHRLAALASLFEYLCEKNAVTHNPVKGVERPKTESGEGKTPAIGDHQARELLAAPGEDTIKSKRDRAILSTLLFHALRREELCKIFDTRAKACRT